MSQPSKSGTDDSLGRIARDVAVIFASPVLMLVAMWIVRIADFVVPLRFTSAGLRSWDFSHWYGVLTMPFLHSSWPHLIANTLPFLILGGILAAQGIARFWSVTGIVMVTSALGAFFLNQPGTVTVGASGLVFGYFGYLVVAAFFAPTWKQRISRGLIAVVVIAIYGTSMLFGVLPRFGHISWQAHLFGLIGGVCAAWLLHQWDARRRLRRPRGSAGRTPAGSAGTGDPELDAILKDLDGR